MCVWLGRRNRTCRAEWLTRGTDAVVFLEREQSIGSQLKAAPVGISHSGERNSTEQTG